MYYVLLNVVNTVYSLQFTVYSIYKSQDTCMSECTPFIETQTLKPK